MKQDPNIFLTLKNNKHWNTQNQNLVVQASAQYASKILDPTYQINTVKDVEIFQLEQRYLYTMFTNKVIIDFGKQITRKHAKTANTQQVYKELHVHTSNSTKANIEASNILQYFPSARFGYET